MEDNKEQTPGQRVLAEILKDQRLSMSSFSEIIGKKYNQIYSLSIGRIYNVSYDLAEAIHSSYPDYEMNWLTTGEGYKWTDNKKAPEDSIIVSLQEQNSNLIEMLANAQRQIDRLISIVENFQRI